TGEPLDFAIEGNGMFIVAGAQQGEDRFYTRAGNFYLDDDGYIVNADGYYLLNTNGEAIQFDEDVQSFSVTENGTINIVRNNQSTSIGQIGLANFSNPAGLEKVGNNLFLNTQNAG